MAKSPRRRSAYVADYVADAARRPLFPVRVTDPKALELRVVPSEGGSLFDIENDWRELENFDLEYVHFGGNFGPHGPHVFAAAPKLLAAVLDLLGPLETAAALLQAQGKRLDKHAQASLDRARAAISEARGEA